MSLEVVRRKGKRSNPNNMFEKNATMELNSSYVNKKQKLKAKRQVDRKTGRPSPAGLHETKKNVLEKSPSSPNVGEGRCCVNDLYGVMALVWGP